MEEEKFRADFHLHIYTSWDDKLYEAGPRSLATLTREFSKRGLNAATMTSFKDNRFDRLMDSARELPYDWGIKESDLGAIVTDEQGRKFYWFNSDEKPTSEGHFLIVGNKRGTPHVKPYQPFGESLEEAKKNSVFLIADHPLMMLRDVRSSGMGEENLRKYTDYFSAAELNGNVRWPFFWEVNRKTEEMCESMGIPVVANSDSYGMVVPLSHLKPALFSNIGKTYNEFERDELDLNSIESFLGSAKNSIEESRHNPVFRANNLVGVSAHITYGLFYRFGKKLGLPGIKHHGDVVEEKL